MCEELVDPVDVELDRFWDAVRPGGEAAERPEAWAFGGTVSLANELLALVLAGTKTSTAGALWDYEADGDPVPEVGQLNILLDGSGKPRALIRISCVAVVPFADVDAEHAWLEGEGDRSLADWREGHEHFFTKHAAHDWGFSTDMPIVLERFEVLYPNTGSEDPASVERSVPESSGGSRGRLWVSFGKPLFPSANRCSSLTAALRTGRTSQRHSGRGVPRGGWSMSGWWFRRQRIRRIPAVGADPRGP